MKDFRNKANKDYEKNAKDFVENHKNCNENDLMQELLQNIANSKQNGTYDRENLLKLANSVSPMMNSKQQARLKEILKML